MRGQVTADVKAPDFAARWRRAGRAARLAPLLKNPAQQSDITGQCEDRSPIASAPASRPSAIGSRGRSRSAGRGAGGGIQARNVRHGHVRRRPDQPGRRRRAPTAAPGRRRGSSGCRRRAAGRVRPARRARPCRPSKPAGAARRSKAGDEAFGRGVPRHRNRRGRQGHRGAPSSRRSRVRRSPRARRRSSGPARTVSSTRRAAACPDLDLPRIGRALAVAALDKTAYDGRSTASSTSRDGAAGAARRHDVACRRDRRSMRAGRFATRPSWAGGCRS